VRARPGGAGDLAREGQPVLLRGGETHGRRFGRPPRERYGGRTPCLLDDGVAAAGGNRARQLEDVLRAQGVELLRVELPGYRQHIDGLLVMVDVDTALMNPTLLPYALIERLRELKIRTIDLHPDDHPFTVNCLALRPGRVVMSEASGHTLDRLARAGIEVLSLPFDGVYRGGGGIHCSTAPLARDPV
jgi:N-dimethylarginine dimethylaminohydrolase